MAAWQAKRVAQTERVRVQSQARYDAGSAASEKGVKICYEWSCQMIQPHKTKHGRSSGSRESHIALNGQKRMQGEAFETIWGNRLLYPGQPGAPAREVCNCHCVLIPDVLMPDETLQENEKHGKMETWPERIAGRAVFKQSEIENGLPIKGRPNSIADKTDNNGRVLQRRIYGDDGMAKIDYDTTDHNLPSAHPMGAHKHVFQYDRKNPHGKPLKLSKDDWLINEDIFRNGGNGNG